MAQLKCGNGFCYDWSVALQFFSGFLVFDKTIFINDYLCNSLCMFWTNGLSNQRTLYFRCVVFNLCEGFGSFFSRFDIDFNGYFWHLEMKYLWLLIIPALKYSVEWTWNPSTKTESFLCFYELPYKIDWIEWKSFCGQNNVQKINRHAS